MKRDLCTIAKSLKKLRHCGHIVTQKFEAKKKWKHDVSGLALQVSVKCLTITCMYQ